MSDTQVLEKNGIRKVQALHRIKGQGMMVSMMMNTLILSEKNYLIILM